MWQHHWFFTLLQIPKRWGGGLSLPFWTPRITVYGHEESQYIIFTYDLSSSIIFFLEWCKNTQTMTGEDFIPKQTYFGFTICWTNWRRMFIIKTRKVRFIEMLSKKCKISKMSFWNILQHMTILFHEENFFKCRNKFW